MWDSLLLVNAKQFGYNTAMKNCIFNTGRRMEYYIALLVFHFPNYILIMKIISFLMIWLCSTIIYKVSNIFFENNDFVNFGIAILSISFPIYSLWFEPIMYSYTFCMLLFFSAILLYLKTYKASSLIKKMIGFLAAAILLFWSFEIQSFYVFIYAVLFALFVKDLSPALFPINTESATKGEGVIQYFASHVLAFFKQHFFIILFPVFSFWLWNKLFPISGMAKMYGYNQISFSIKSMLYHFGFSCFKLLVMLPYLLAGIVQQLANHIVSIVTIILATHSRQLGVRLVDIFR